MYSSLQCSGNSLLVPRVCRQDDWGSVLVLMAKNLTGGVELYGGHVSEVALTLLERYEFGQTKLFDE